MKALGLLLAAFGLLSIAVPALVVVVVASHPWLAAGALVGNVQVVQATPAPRAVPAVPTLAPLPGLQASAAALVAEAMRWVDARVPYRWGGCTPAGVDCSCFVRLVYAALGIQVPRTTVLQVAFDRPISRAELAVGDTLFFNDTCDHATCGANPTHEGLYVGGGLMIEAGDPVQVAALSSPYWTAHFASAGRPPGL